MFNLSSIIKKVETVIPDSGDKKLGLFQRFLNTIAGSVRATNTVSSVRVQSYIVLLSIILSCVTFLTIEMVNAIIAWVHKQPYTISTQFIVMLSMLLAHHLGVLFNRSKAYDPTATAQGLSNLVQNVNTTTTQNDSTSTQNDSTSTQNDSTNTQNDSTTTKTQDIQTDDADVSNVSTDTPTSNSIAAATEDTNSGLAPAQK